MQLTDVIDRLSVEFQGEFSQDAVEVVVKQAAAKWEGAPVQVFIPLLAENAARRRLKSVPGARRSSKP